MLCPAGMLVFCLPLMVMPQQDDQPLRAVLVQYVSGHWRGDSPKRFLLLRVTVSLEALLEVFCRVIWL